eukprot:GEZU01026042.1.p1 GENE.GEZU01026042.1~~GEZU01026042.1.p1  ORF type:complete len:419 (-),score=127.70 GEZU01026042.1:749-2005(-)
MSNNRNNNNTSPSQHTSFPKDRIKILLLENISPVAKQLFEAETFQVECISGALSEEELIQKIPNIHALGIRSKTNITTAVLAAANKLLTIGCFCIGTNQVDLDAAEKRGIPVFNSPFSNSRSVAELIIAEIISLARRLPDKVQELHKGQWKKSAANCFEVRGKTLGIVGYGHIGSQLSVLAEALGLRVIFYDIATVMPIGNSQPMKTLDELLQQADFVTLHVPETPETKNMIGPKQIAMMKKGSYLLNASRGTVVDIDALAEALKSGHLNGAAVDVYPEEPEGNTDNFETPLRGCPNTILTPHIGGSTLEAQTAIGVEVATAIIKYINSGRTIGAVNFPNVDLRITPDTHRILNIHKNVPGVMKAINEKLANHNIRAQLLDTSKYIGYLIIDVDQEASNQLKKEIAALEVSFRTRILY